MIDHAEPGGGGPRSRLFTGLAAGALLLALSIGVVIIGSQLLKLRGSPAASHAAPSSTAGDRIQTAAMARVLVGNIEMRAAPDEQAALVGSPLVEGDHVYVFGGPKVVGGTAWYGVQSAAGIFGWVHGGEGDASWLATETPTCPPADVVAIEGMHPAQRLLCFGTAELTIDAWLPVAEGLGGDPGFEAEPYWLAPPSAITAVSANAQEFWTAGLSFRLTPDVAQPAPIGWVRLSAHFDDPAAAQCVRTYRPGYTGEELDPSLVKLECREQLVVTGIERLPFPAAPLARNGRLIFVAPAEGGTGEMDVISSAADGSDRRNHTIASTDTADRPVWSPDGQRFAYDVSAADGGSVVVSSLDGPPTTVQSGTFAFRIAWSPDGKRLALSVHGETDIVDLQGNVSLVTLEALDSSDLAWSPSGAWLAFAYGRNLMAVHTYTGETRLLTTEATRVEFPSWTPDETHVIFMDRTITDGFATGADIFSAALDGSGVVDITNSPDRFEDQRHLSPDGKRIVTIADFHLLVMDADGGNVREVFRLTPRGAPSAVWSPDGKQLAVVNDGHIWVVPVDSGDPIDLGPGYEPNWQPLP